MTMTATAVGECGPGTVPGEWYGEDLAQDAWRLAMPPEVVDEVERAVTTAEAAPVDAGDFPATLAFLASVRARLFDGPGAVVCGRLPFEHWPSQATERAVSLLARLMGPPVEQTHDGVTLYAVEDRGFAPAPGVRRSLTNVEQEFHTDGPWVERTPAVVSLHCVRSARAGGVSRCISLRALFRDLELEAPDLHARLERDFLWHRQSEHAPGEPPFSRLPMLWHEGGRWCARFYADYVRTGYRAAGVQQDDEARRALERLAELAAERRRWLQFTLLPGEIEWVNNRWCAHSRTAFEPRDETACPRLLYRVWHRLDGGPVTLDG